MMDLEGGTKGTAHHGSTCLSFGNEECVSMISEGTIKAHASYWKNRSVIKKPRSIIQMEPSKPDKPRK